MSARPKRILIEFTKDTKDAVGSTIRAEGSRLLVDEMSARSFVDKKKVAKVIDEKQQESEAKKAVDAEPVVDQPVAALGGAS